MGLFVGIEPMVEVLMEPGEEDVGADIAEDDEYEHHYIWFQMKKQGEKRLSHKNDVHPVKQTVKKQKHFIRNSIGVMHLSLCW